MGVAFFSQMRGTEKRESLLGNRTVTTFQRPQGAPCPPGDLLLVPGVGLENSFALCNCSLDRGFLIFLVHSELFGWTLLGLKSRIPWAS